MTPACVPTIKCRTLDTTYRICVVPRGSDLVRWRLQFEVVIAGMSVKAFNPKIRFYLGGGGGYMNQTILA